MAYEYKSIILINYRFFYYIYNNNQTFNLILLLNPITFQ
jgi:hypothetical protein